MIIKKHISLIDYFTYSIILLFPIFYIVGPAILNISIIIICLCYLFIFLDRGLYKLINVNDKLFIYFFILLIFSIYIIFHALIINKIDSYSFIKKVSIIRFFIFSFALSYFLHNTKINKKYIYSFYLFVIIFVSLDIVFQFFFNQNILGYKSQICIWKDSKIIFCERYSGVFGKELVSGSFLSTIGLLALMLFFYKKKLNYKILLSTYLLIFISIFLSGERSSLMIFFLATFLVLIFSRVKKKNIIYFLLIIFFLFFLILKNVKHLEHRYITWPSEQFKTSFLAKDKQSESTADEQINNLFNTYWGAHYIVAFEIFKNNPIFGTGLGSFRYYCSKYDFDYINSKKIYKNLSLKNSGCSTHPHNYYFELLSELGIVGFFIFSFFIYKLNLLFFIDLKKNNNFLLLGIFSILFAILFPIKPTGSISGSWGGSIFWFIFGFYLYFFNISNKNKH